MKNLDELILLENDRVRLEPIMDVSECQKIEMIALNELNLLQYSPSDITTKEKLKKYFRTALEAKNKGVAYPFLIFDKLTNQYAGSTRFGNISIENQRLEIGWTWIGEAFQRTGLNQNVKKLLLEYVFNKLEGERVEFRADARNIKSRRAMEKLGAKHEGTLRSHTLMRDGVRRDTVYYSILRDEWLEKQD